MEHLSNADMHIKCWCHTYSERWCITGLGVYALHIFFHMTFLLYFRTFFENIGHIFYHKILLMNVLCLKWTIIWYCEFSLFIVVMSRKPNRKMNTTMKLEICWYIDLQYLRTLPLSTENNCPFWELNFPFKDMCSAVKNMCWSVFLFYYPNPFRQGNHSPENVDIGTSSPIFPSELQ